MDTSHIRSIMGNVIKFIKTKLSFLASTFCLLFSKSQVSATHMDELNESQGEHNSVKGMTTFCSLNINADLALIFILICVNIT